jgi:DMSO/TMAO reductase YedYZ molybdopterin-dependent catalytic subunit
MESDSGTFAGDERKVKEREMRATGRLRSGQALTLKWPVLHYGSVPHFDSQYWEFKIFGLVERPRTLSWPEIKVLPRINDVSDFHCVTRWSRFDNTWTGISTQEIAKLAKPKVDARFVLVHGAQGYTANLPLADFLREHVLFATHHDGQPLTEDHGGPLRLIVPHLYAWKSVKWVRGVEFSAGNVPGFWERNGYHNYGDPFLEQRYDEPRVAG